MISKSYRTFFDELYSKSKTEMIPFLGEFEFTSKCNLKCKFCYVVNSADNISKELTTDEWLKIIKDAVKEGMIQASFTGGEVLTRPDFEEIYNKSYDMGVRILVKTNGTLINQKIIEIFKKRPPEGVSITIYGGSNKSYQLVTGLENGFNRIQESIDLLVSNSIPVSLKTMAIPEIFGELHTIKELANKYSLQITYVSYLSPIRTKEDKTDMTWRLSPQDILKGIEIIEKDSISNNLLKKVNYTTGSSGNSLADCTAGKARFAVSSEGKMFGCLSYTELYSDLNTLGFKNALAELRNKLINKTESCYACNSCDVYAKCSKCPGLNFSETGNIEKCSKYRKELAKFSIL